MFRNSAPITIYKLMKEQEAGRKTMVKNGGWAEKGGEVSRRTMGKLVEAGVAQWTINISGGHWAAHLLPGPDVLLVDEAREAAAPHYPQAHDFQTVIADAGRFFGYTFRTDHSPNARYGWITVYRAYGKVTEPSRAAAAALLPAAVLEDGRRVAALRRRLRGEGQSPRLAPQKSFSVSFYGLERDGALPYTFVLLADDLADARTRIHHLPTFQQWLANEWTDSTPAPLPADQPGYTHAGLPQYGVNFIDLRPDQAPDLANQRPTHRDYTPFPPGVRPADALKVRARDLQDGDWIIAAFQGQDTPLHYVDIYPAHPVAHGPQCMCVSCDAAKSLGNTNPVLITREGPWDVSDAHSADAFLLIIRPTAVLPAS